MVPVRTPTRIAAVAVTATLTVALAACTGTSPSTGTGPPPASSTAAPSSVPAPVSDGVTTTADVFGPGCSRLPQGSAPGSPTAMGPLRVVAAAATNPLLTTLAAAIGTVPGLGDSLDAQPGLTVFAPADTAFVALRGQLGAAAYDALLADPNKLGALLQYHVAGTRHDAATLVAARTSGELTGGVLTIGGTPQDPTVTDGKGDVATVLCGNIPTANATVFVIDKVLTPAS